MNKPKRDHWDVIMMILKILKASPGKCLLFRKGPILDILAYFDAGYVGFDDKKRRLIFAYLWVVIWYQGEAKNS